MKFCALVHIAIAAERGRYWSEHPACGRDAKGGIPEPALAQLATQLLRLVIFSGTASTLLAVTVSFAALQRCGGTFQPPGNPNLQPP